MRKAYQKQLRHWEENAVEGANYKECSTLFNRDVKWENKHDAIPNDFNETYKSELKKAGYKGDIHDYKAIINHVKTHKPEPRNQEKIGTECNLICEKIMPVRTLD